jgi:glyoxylase-like metal-dependent hydrolase (beta-lactamase superfamily II)
MEEDTMHIDSFFDPDTSTITYLVADPESGKAAIIDPVLDYEPNAARLTTRSADKVLASAKAQGFDIDWVLDTHAHADHLSAGDYIRRQTGALYGIGAHIRDVQTVFKPLFNGHDVSVDGHAFDRLFEDGDRFEIGGLTARVLHTPGHTPACISYQIEDAVFVGDTLFMPDFGTARADFPGGDAATLYQSIRKLLSLPETTRIFVGHDYLPAGRDHFAWETSVAAQRAGNIHARDGVSEADYVAMRETRDATLPAPKLILPSLQVNIRAGALPPKDDDGQTYLKIPINRI